MHQLRAAKFNQLLSSDKAIIRLLALLMATILARLLFAVLLHPLRIGHDQALHFTMGSMLLSGKTLYVDMYDSNPPLIYYLDTLPAAAARIFHIPPVLSFSLFIWSLAALGAAFAFYIVTKYAKKRDLVSLLVLIVGYCLFSLSLGGDYGQREHICIVCFVPFFLLRTLRWSGRSIDRKDAILSGIVAGIGICLKHYFLVIVVALELFWILDKRRFRHLWAPEAVAAIATGLTYMFHFLLVPAGMRDGYFKFMVPVYSQGYGFWDTNLVNLLSAPENKESFGYLPLACMAGLILARRNSFLPTLVIYTLAGTVIYMIQFKGWHYHAFPALSGSFLLIGLVTGIVLTLLSQRLSLPKYSLVSAAALLAIPILIYSAVTEYVEVTSQPQFDMTQLGYTGSSPLSDIGPFADPILKNTKVGDPVLFLSNAVRPAFPVSLQLERSAGSRHLHAIPLSLFLYIADTSKEGKGNKLLQYENTMIEQYEEDLHKIRPKLILIQDVPVRDYLAKAPYKFEQTQLGDYDNLGVTMGFVIYKLKEKDHGS